MEVFSGLLALVAIVYAVNQHWALLFVALFALVGIWAAYECKSGRLEKLTAPLKEGTWEREYRTGLTAVLDWFDGFLVPPEHRDPKETSEDWSLTSKNRAWNWMSYDRMLLLAVVYPLLTPLIVWTIVGNAVSIGDLPLIPSAPNDWSSRGLSAVGILLFIFSRVLARRAIGTFESNKQLSKSQLAFSPYLLSQVVLAALRFVAIFAIALSAARAGIGAFQIETYIAVGNFETALVISLFLVFWLSLSDSNEAKGSLNIAVAVCFASTFPILGFLQSVYFGICPVLAAIILDNAVEKRWRTAFVYLCFTAVAVSQIAWSTFSADIWDYRATTGLIFLAVLPLLNAIFDFISLGLTRYCLRRSLEDGHFKWWLYDAVGAFATLAGLGLSLIISIHFLNQIAIEPLFDLSQLFIDMRDPDKDMLWLYFTFFSTLLPTIAHLIFFICSRAMVWPGASLRLKFAQRLADSDGTDLIGLSYFGFWVTCVVGALAAITYAFRFVLPAAHNSFLKLCIWGFEIFAGSIGAI